MGVLMVLTTCPCSVFPALSVIVMGVFENIAMAFFL